MYRTRLVVTIPGWNELATSVCEFSLRAISSVSNTFSAFDAA